MRFFFLIFGMVRIDLISSQKEKYVSLSLSLSLKNICPILRDMLINSYIEMETAYFNLSCLCNAECRDNTIFFPLT